MDVVKNTWIAILIRRHVLAMNVVRRDVITETGSIIARSNVEAQVVRVRRCTQAHVDCQLTADVKVSGGATHDALLVLDCANVGSRRARYVDQRSVFRNKKKEVGVLF